ncbi:MAG: hypothetical protein GKR92_09215 [Gammaproteobacteria bacterium]|nr:MAG: hypothetical protein GKR92_09215 [Gammaproteobacteria bacterium]
MDDLFIKWRTMWDAKEYTIQLFFLFNFLTALYVASLPLRSGGKDITAMNRSIMIGFGVGYAVLVVFAYFQLIPTFSPYS